MADEDRESLRCSICLDLFRNPVIIPCGHSFCKDCIAGLWDHQDVWRCPQCKHTFSHRPALKLSEKMMKMRTRAEDVSCDSCTSRRSKAIRSCLTCLASFCSTHLEQHNELHGRRNHQLTDATDLQDKICSQHGKLIDVFCRTDQQCVCVLCAIHEHKSHDTISASEERADRQRKLMETRVKFLRNIQDREKDYEELTQAGESIRVILPPAGGNVKLPAASGKKHERWECDFCLVLNRGSASHCVSCEEPKPKMKSKNPSAPANPSIKFCFGSLPDRCAATLFKDSGLNLQSKGNATPAIESSTVQADSTCSISTLASTCGFEFGNRPSSVFKFDVEQYKKKEDDSESGSVQLDRKDVFRFGQSVRGFDFSFQYVPSKSSSVRSESEASSPGDVEETHEPDVTEISTAEENEQVVFSHKAKLYRFDKEFLQWKERGVGELRILQNDKRARLVMRRERVLNLCANHWITPNMKLEPMKATVNAWTWNAFDFADGEGGNQTLAVRFKLRESADAFRKIFEEAVATASSVPERGKSTQDRCDADVEILFECKPTAEQAELAAKLMLPHTFFCYKNQPGYLSDEDDEEDFEEAVRSLKGRLYPGVSVRGDASSGHDANLPRENAGAATETQSDSEDDDDDDDDEAPVELPSFEENEEEMLFKERTKLYRWDCDIKKWKASSEGDIQIRFHPRRKIYRVFMRREGGEKVCVNHCITRAVRLKALNSSANAVTWTAADSSEGDAALRPFAVKFKTAELAVSFTRTFTDCQSHMSEFMRPSET